MRDKDYYSLAFVGLEPIPQRPQKYGEPTEVMVIPISLVPKIQKMLDALEKKATSKAKTNI